MALPCGRVNHQRWEMNKQTTEPNHETDNIAQDFYTVYICIIWLRQHIIKLVTTIKKINNSGRKTDHLRKPDASCIPVNTNFRCVIVLQVGVDLTTEAISLLFCICGILTPNKYQLSLTHDPFRGYAKLYKMARSYFYWMQKYRWFCLITILF